MQLNLASCPPNPSSTRALEYLLAVTKLYKSNDDDVPEDVKFIEDPGANRPDSVAARWYANLGNNNNNNAFGFSFQKEYAAAKQKQQGILGTSSSVGQLAVSNSPFYNFLKERNLDKGIL